MDRVVSPLDQLYSPEGDSEEVSITALPGQIFVEPLAEMVGLVGDEVFTTVVVAEVAEHPPEETVTE